MRRKDYPKGKGLGVRRATKEHILKVLDANPNNPRLTAIITAINDSGLGVSDLCTMNCKPFLENPNAKIILYQTLRIKTGDTIKTFFAEESITAINNYLNQRRKGTRKIPPETITPESPLFVQYSQGKPIARALYTTRGVNLLGDGLLGVLVFGFALTGGIMTLKRKNFVLAILGLCFMVVKGATFILVTGDLLGVSLGIIILALTVLSLIFTSIS